MKFDIENKLSFLFVKCYAIILANSMSIPVIDNHEYLKTKILELKSNLFTFELTNIGPVKKYKRYDNIKNEEISIDQKRLLEKQKRKDIEQRLNIYKQELMKTKKEANNLNIFEIKQNIHNIFINQEYKKNDDVYNDENIHNDFIFAASNLRAQIFKIEKEDKINIQLIIKKIIPSIATTTASIAGLVSLQLYTLLQTNDIKFLRDNSFNFSLNSFEFTYPTPYQENQRNQESLISKIKIIWNYIIYDLLIKAIIKVLNKNKTNEFFNSTNELDIRNYCKKELNIKRIYFNLFLISKTLILFLFIVCFLNI